MTAASTTAAAIDHPHPGWAARAPILPPLSISANVGWTLCGNAVYAACQWGMLIALAKLGSPEMVGAFSLALAITAPVVLLTNLQLAQIQATDTRRSYGFGDYLGLRLAMCAVALAGGWASSVLSATSDRPRRTRVYTAQAANDARN